MGGKRLNRPVTGKVCYGTGYAEIEATRGQLPSGYRHDRHVVEFGGERTSTGARSGLWPTGKHTAEPA